MSHFIRSTLAATASAGVLVLSTIGGAQAAGDPSPSALTPSTLSTSSTAPTAGSTAGSTTRPRLSKHERKQRREHRRKVRRQHRISRAFRVAARQQGDPYRYGATGPSAFDCSGLMLYAFRAAGLHLPRTAAAQSGAVRHISRAHMHRGDLVFFNGGGHVYHVGIFDGWSHGRRMMIDAPHTGTDVRREAIWSGSWFPGTLRLA